MVILVIALIFFGPIQAAESTEDTFRALSFGRTVEDYVQFRPSDMSPFVKSFTVCAWMKREHTASHPIVLHYSPGNVIIGDNGQYNYVNQNLDLRGKFPEANIWFHSCMSWAAGGRQRVYVNGVEIGSTSAVSSNLHLGGEITLGNQVSSSKSTSHIFGGQLYKLNLYSEQLSSSQIREMSAAGLCSQIEEKYETRKLKWEQILTKQRYGHVKEFTPTECAYIAKLQSRLNQTETELRLKENELLDTRTKMNGTEQELQEVSTTLNKTLSKLTETSTELSGTQKRLAEKLLQTESKLNSTEHELQEVSAALNDTRSLLEDARRLETINRWDVLFTPPYLNKIFTRQLYEQLNNGWNMMEHFIGVNVTRGFVEHFRQYHEKHEVDEGS